MTREELLNIVERINERHDNDESTIEDLGEIVRAFDEKPTDEYKTKYNDLLKKYKDRFFSNIEEVKEEQKEDIEKDDNSENLTFEALFKDREGDYKREEK